jgi:hypothetical protein
MGHLLYKKIKILFKHKKIIIKEFLHVIRCYIFKFDSQI